MASDPQTILRDALALGHDDRVGIAAELLASLEGDIAENGTEPTQAWADELDRRATQILTGVESTDAWDVVRERTLDDLTR